MNGNAAEPTGQREPSAVLRDLAWTVHRRVPEMGGSDPLSTTELAVLKHLLDSPGITVSDLSRHLDLRQSNTSATIRALADRGLVDREASPTDRRVTMLIPTGKALAEDEAIADAWSGTIRTALVQLGPDDIAAIEAASDALHRLDQLMRAEQSARQSEQ